MNRDEFKQLLNETLDEKFKENNEVIKKYVDNTTDILAGITKENFVRVKAQLDKVSDKLERLEFNTSGLNNRVSTLEDQMRIVKTKLNFS